MQMHPESTLKVSDGWVLAWVDSHPGLIFVNIIQPFILLNPANLIDIQKS